MKEREYLATATTSKHRRVASSIKYQTLNDIAYQNIRKRITNLTIRPGEQLIEQRLAEDLGISKSPIREAFRQLEKTGLVHLIPHRGCFVSPLSLKEFREALQFREILEVQCLSIGLPRYSDLDLVEIRKMEQTAEKRFDQGNKEAASEFHRKVHALIVKKAGNSLIEKTYEELLQFTLRRYLVLALRQSSSITETWADEHHRALFRAIEKRNVDLAVRALQKHLRSMGEQPAILDTIERYSSHRS
jgi:DNA-binding GntR family transcriptional regulator